MNVDRTVRNWRPMRFGGGLGGRKAVKSKKQLAEDAAKAAMELEKTRAAGIYGPAGLGDAASGGRDRDR